MTDYIVKKNIGLGRALADILLPSSGYGKQAEQGGGCVKEVNGNQNYSNGKKRGKAKLILLSPPQYIEDAVKVEFLMKMGTEKKTIKLSLLINSDTRKYDADTWEEEEELGCVYPLQIELIEIESFAIGADEDFNQVIQCRIERDCMSNVPENIEVKKVFSKKFESWVGISVSVDSMTGYCIKGSLTFSSTDRKIQSLLDIE